MLFCGIDLHSNNSFVVVSDDNDKVLFSKWLPNNLMEVCAALGPYRQELCGIVVESTYNWYWLVDGLKHRGDESDARHLAHLLRLGLLPEGHIMPRPVRALRDLARKRIQLIQMRTSNIVSIETCLAQQTGSRIGTGSAGC